MSALVCFYSQSEATVESVVLCAEAMVSSSRSLAHASLDFAEENQTLYNLKGKQAGSKNLEKEKD